MKNDYLFGAVYIIEQDYMDDEIKKDLKYMKDAGFSLITLWPVTNPWLAKTSTEHVFTQTIKVMDECLKLEMKCILQLFGQNPSQEFMCDSLLNRDMMIHDEEGEHINYNEYWMNMNHPVVRELIEDYFSKAINALKDHPALYAWDVFNEAHFRSDDRHTIHKYQEWLAKKYKNIETLNHYWYRRYEAFSQIDPLKRRSTYSVWSSLLPSIEYERFRSVNVTEICRFLYETAYKYDNKHPIMIDGTSSQILFDSVIARNNDEFDTAYVPDIYGGTFYPKSWGRNYKTMPWMAALYFKIPASAARQANKPYFVNELQTHTQSALTPGSDVTPQELINWTLMSIFTGAQGIQLWRWRPFLHGYQSTGRGITQTDGIPNARCDGIKRVINTISAAKDFFISGKISNLSPIVQIGLSYRSRLIYDAFTKWQKNNWPSAVAGWHRAFWNFGLPIEFVNLDDLGDSQKAIPVMVLPSIVSLSGLCTGWLVDYVRNGGLLIADGRMNAVNEWAEVPREGIPGKKLSEVFGIQEIDAYTDGKFLLNGEHIDGNFQNQLLEAVDGAEIIARTEDGYPAVVMNHYGRGKTLYFNTFLGAAMEQGVPKPVDKLLRELTAAQCPDAIFMEKDEQLHVSFLKQGIRRMMLLVNFAWEEKTLKFCNVKKTLILRNIVTGQETSGNGDFTMKAPSGEQIFELKEQT